MKGNKGQIKRIKINLFLLFILSLTVCERHNEEFEPLLNVYCVLKNNLSYQKVVVDRTYEMDEKSIYDLEDVQVILSGNGICDTLVPDSLYGDSGLFRTRDSFPVNSGEGYFLRVSAKGFDTLTGMTTVPDSFQVIYPDEGDTVSLMDSLIFKFLKSNQLFWISGYFQDSLSIYNVVGVIKDTIYVLPISSFASDNGFYKIKISIPDSNFVDYFYWHFNSIPKCGVENGIGLFGSMYVKEIDFYVGFEQK
ncbi:MAG: DUF4249 family protein [bacterium]